MWNTFWPDVLVALIGAVLTIATGAGAFAITRRLAETRALNALTRELHHRRALKISARREIPDAQELDDYHRLTASVLTMRDEIRHARDASGSSDDVQEPLAAMTRACNLYLELSAASPERYWILADDLRQALRKELVKVTSKRRGVTMREPGGGAFDATAASQADSSGREFAGPVPEGTFPARHCCIPVRAAASGSTGGAR